MLRRAAGGAAPVDQPENPAAGITQRLVAICENDVIACRVYPTPFPVRQLPLCAFAFLSLKINNDN
jgi:hypothetical protein